jgi:predicted ester cyclase
LVIALGEQAKPNAASSSQIEPGQQPQITPGQPSHMLNPQVKPSRSGANENEDEKNKAVVRHVFDELFTQGRYEFIERIYTHDCKVHHGGNLFRLEEVVAEGKGWRSAAPDLRMTIEQMTVDGNMVTVNWLSQGTHTGRGNGLLKPTGKRVVIRGRSMFRVVNGKIAEVWNEYDRDEVFRQVGVNPKVGHLFDASQAVWLSVNRFFTGTEESAVLGEAGQ